MTERTVKALRKIANDNEDMRRAFGSIWYANALADEQGYVTAGEHHSNKLYGPTEGRRLQGPFTFSKIGEPNRYPSPEGQRQYQIRAIMEDLEPYKKLDVRTKRAYSNLYTEAGRDNFNRTDPKTLKIKPRPTTWWDGLLKKLSPEDQELIKKSPAEVIDLSKQQAPLISKTRNNNSSTFIG